ncbi:MAG: hypothetical protein ISS15_00790 [Alphaproteobacteria bacterium]|nr:hypothetical protein [Alphaproteobacteria bacterium]MBL6937272.1 hypothetical protein [Alphaproteobacteria bacterium]MBL7096166.1 hypothetical protein [Alphaproteobacteria bacterium]
MTPRDALIVLLNFVPCCAAAEQKPYDPVWVPPKLIAYHNKAHTISCDLSLPSDAFQSTNVIHVEYNNLVNPDGTTKSVVVREDSGMPDVAPALVSCAMNWLFVPATIDGKAVEATSTTYVTTSHMGFSH